MLIGQEPHKEKMMNKVLVTGGAGFIGSNLVDKLIDMGVEVTVIDDLSTGKKDNINSKANHWLQDLTEITSESLGNTIKSFGIDTIFHLAAKTAVQESILEPELYNKSNVDVTLKLLEASRIAGVNKFVFSSSSSVYGDAEIPTTEYNEMFPLSPYATTKLIGEEYCKLYSEIHGIKTCILRYFNVYGNRMNNEGGYKLVLPIFKELKEKGKKLTINNDGNQRRDFVHVDDICDMNILCAQYDFPYKFRTFNVGTGISYSVNEIADMFGTELKKEYRNGVIEPFETLSDMSKANKELNFKPKDRLKIWVGEYSK